MLGEIFYWLLNMSLIATLMGLIVLGLRAIPRIPRRYAIWLWLVPLLRMWIPVGMGSRWSLMTLISKFTTRTIVVWEKGDMSFAMTNSLMVANNYFPIRYPNTTPIEVSNRFPITYRVNLLEELFRTVSIVWLGVAVAILLTFAVLYVTTRRELRGAKHLRDRVYLSEKVTSPALYGMVRPRIILPCGWENKEELPFILAHEYAHGRRGDNVWRALAFVTAALHWFNPFAWLFLRTFLSDLELACDERVMREMDASTQKQYALALVDTARAAREKNLFASAFGGARIRVRVERILGYRHISRFSAVCFTLLMITIAYMLLTNAK